MLQFTDESSAALAHQRLAAGNFKLADAKVHGSTADTQKLLVAQNLLMRHMARHLRLAITAVQIAAIREGDAQVIYITLILVFHNGPLSFNQ